MTLFRLARRYAGPLLFGLGLSAAVPASAGSALAGNVTIVIATMDGGIIFHHSSTHVSDPACDTDHRWYIAGATAGGQPMVATLLTAFSTGKKITIVGTGTCTGTSENVGYFYVDY